MQTIIPILKDGAIIDNKLWFFENNIQALCQMSMENFEMEIAVPSYSKPSMWLFHWRDRLYTISMDPLWIMMFDKNSLQSKEILNTKLSFEGQNRISNIFQQDNVLWLIPCFAKNSLWYFDMNSNQFERDSFFSDYINKLTNENEMLICRSSLSEHELWCVVYKKSYLLKYDVKRKQITKVILPEVPGTLDSILYSEGSIWVTVEENSNIYRIKDKVTTEIVVSGNQSYSNMYETEAYIIVLPRFGNSVVMIDKRTLNVHIIALPGGECVNKVAGASKILNILEREQDILLFPNAVDNLLILNKETLRINSIQIKCSSLYQRIERGKKFIRGNQWKESDAFPFRDYLDYVLWNRKEKSDGNKLSAFGEVIYRECMK